MPRKPRKIKSRKPEAEVHPAIRFLLETGQQNESLCDEKCDVLDLFVADPATLWKRHGKEIMSEWLLDHPCTRPHGWWRHEAPEPRRRLGGTGTSSHEVLAYGPSFSFGVPDSFVSEWQQEYYNGRAFNVYGDPIGVEYKEGSFEGKAIDPSDPPVFESQAAYLGRHNLLTEGEWRFLAKHPELLQPEVLSI